MTIIEAIILTIFDVVSFILVSKKLTNIVINKKNLIISLIIFPIIIGIESQILDGWAERNLIGGWLSTVLSILLLIVLIYYLYHQRIMKTIFIFIICAILITTVQFITLNPLQLIFGEITYNFSSGLVAQSLNVILIIIMIKWIPINHVYGFVISKNRAFEYIVINMFVVLVFLLIYWNTNIEGIIENLITITTISLIIMCINFIVLKNSLKNEQALNKLKVNEQYMPIIDELISDIKTRQHDFKNHLQALGMMMFASKDKDDLLDRFEKYTGEIILKDDLNEFLKYNNMVIAGFLYGKKSQAEAMNIKFSIHINETNFVSKLFDYEWIELFGIFIDNAMETNVENNEIVVIIDKEKDMNVLIVKNKHPYLEKEMLKNMFNRGVSSKSKSNRGYGLYNVKQITTKYKGSIEAYNETGDENYVVIKVLIP